MDIQLKDAIDLYKKGNFVKTFSDVEEVKKYLEEIYDNLRWAYPDEQKRKEYMNNGDYSIIGSKYFKFM